MSIVVFFLSKSNADASLCQLIPNFVAFKENEILLALSKCNELRKRPDVCHVTISSELQSSVGKAGVDAVVDGKTPDGVDYTWSKAGRAGKTRRK